MNVNDRICGFQVTRARENEELGGTLWELQHQATGTKVAWLDNGESNKLFSIAFKTLPWDDTGVFHILEHSVLNGSEKYPVKEPFVNLLKSSMNTFLNAMTFPDKTMYPVSSRNTQDFLNLTSVYLDAVFCPAIYRNPNIFYQEGWHYALEEEGAMPSYNGVVFNEMKGAFSSPDTLLNQGIMTLLFPDSCYGYVSGGHPEHIPQLSYEQFLDAHRSFYAPNNAKVYLDGAVPLEEVLTMLDGYFTRCPLGQTHVLTMQGDLPYRAEVQYYEAEDDADAMLIVGQRMGTWQDRKTLMALAVLSGYLTGSNEAPLKKAILESGIAEDATMFVEDSIAQPFIALQVRQMDGSRKDELLALVRDFLSRHTIDRKDLLATVDQMEFTFRDAQEPKGLMRNILGMNTWLFDGDILDGMTFTPLFAALRQEQEDYFQALLAEITLSGDNAAELLLLPASQKGIQDAQAEEDSLSAAASAWSREDRKNLVQMNETLALWQAASDTQENLDTLPILPISQISGEIDQIPTQLCQIGGCPVLVHKTSQHDICHYRLFFSLADLSVEQIQKLSLMTNLLGELPTASSTVAQLEQLKKSTLANLDYNVVAYQDREQAQLCKPFFAVSFSALAHKETAALELVRQILLETSFGGDAAREWIRIILSQGQEGMRQSIIAEGTRFASLRAASHSFAASLLAEKAEGYDFYCCLKSLNEDFDSQIEQLQKDFAELAGTVFCAVRLTISLAAGTCTEAVQELIRKLPEGKKCPDAMHLAVDGELAKEAIVIPSAVSYAAASGCCPEAFHGGMDLLTGILNYDYLWSEIRVKGGAYGCGFRASSGGSITFSSYRDPSPMRSQKVFADADTFVKDFCGQNTSLDSYILGAAASQEPLLHDRESAQRAAGDYFMGITAQQRNLWRKQLLAMTGDDLLAAAQWLHSIPYAQCIVGCKDALEGTDGWKILTL